MRLLPAGAKDSFSLVPYIMKHLPLSLECGCGDLSTACCVNSAVYSQQELIVM